MRLGYIGLGKMGSNMVLRLIEKKHSPIVFDVNKKSRTLLKRKGAHAVDSITELTHSLPHPRLIWLMIPYQHVDQVLSELLPHLKKGDTIIDGGNSFYKDTQKRAKKLEKKGINYLDVGVSGGPNGARNGACMMIGGKQSVYKKYRNLFKDLCVNDGYNYVGKSGAGHYVKMVHNGIEYGMMQAIAEGFDMMNASKEFKLNLKSISNIYAHGSVIESNLISWLSDGFNKYGNDLKKVSGAAVGSGEGYWTVETAKKLRIQTPVIEKALDNRKQTQKKPSFQGKIIMTLRNMFGGHDIQPDDLTIK